MNIEFPKFALAAVAPFMAKKDVRYYLNGAMIEREKKTGHAVFVATNGHTLGAVRVECLTLPEDWKPLILPRDSIASALKFKGDTLEYAGGILSGGGSSVLAAPIDGRFPDWRSCVPVARGVEDAAPVCFAPGIIEPMLESVAALVKHGGVEKKWAGLKMFTYGEHATLFAPSGVYPGVFVTYVAMPLRESDAMPVALA